MKEKICLITPPSPFLLDERVFMHIGILKVASSLEKEGFIVDFLDLSGVENYLKVIDDYCNQNIDTKVFGLTASTPQVPFAVNIAQLKSSRSLILTLMLVRCSVLPICSAIPINRFPNMLE